LLHFLLSLPIPSLPNCMAALCPQKSLLRASLLYVHNLIGTTLFRTSTYKLVFSLEYIYKR
jgi:hypothetical protein